MTKVFIIKKNRTPPKVSINGWSSPIHQSMPNTKRQSAINRRNVQDRWWLTASARSNGPHDPARFIGTVAVTKEGETADVHSYLDENKIIEEAQFDGLYAVCTDLLDDDVSAILKVSESRWQIEECFRVMKTDFAARPVYLQNENRIKAHFLVCFLALLSYRLLERRLNYRYTCKTILYTLKAMNFASVKEQGGKCFKT